MPISPESVKKHIVQTCKTKVVVDMVVGSLHSMCSASYALDFDLNDYMKRNFSPALYEILFSEFNSLDRRALGAYINALTASLGTCTVVKLTIAFVPDTHYVGLLYDWFGSHSKVDDFVLDIVSDASIVAGVIVDYKGSHLDMSFRSKIDTVFQDY